MNEEARKASCLAQYQLFFNLCLDRFLIKKKQANCIANAKHAQNACFNACTA
jgi:hypothetical protein